MTLDARQSTGNTGARRVRVVCLMPARVLICFLSDVLKSAARKRKQSNLLDAYCPVEADVWKLASRLECFERPFRSPF